MKNSQPTNSSLLQGQEQKALERVALWEEKLEVPLSYKTDWLVKLFLVSDYAYQWVIKNPSWILEFHEFLEQDFDEIKRHYLNISTKQSNDISEFEIKRWLRKQRHFYSITCIVFQLTDHLNIRQITKLQSILANQLIKVAYSWVKQLFVSQYGKPFAKDGTEQELITMLMGKLGGAELNFSSDIDLIFCYPESGETKIRESSSERSIDNQKFFTRLAQKLVALLHETTADGFVYRVDMRLRPYGESGALVLSFDAMADYYLEQGREWERFAMIKADYLSPDENAVKKIRGIIKPFSFRRYIDFSVLDSIRQLKHKITAEMQHRNLTTDIKLGQGGIRELEFIVQSLQLISGGRNPQLQVKNWWVTLEELNKLELLKNDDARELKVAYEFLRRLENVLQFQRNEQTQQLPKEEEQKALVAYAMKFTSWLDFYDSLSKHRNFVDRFFKQLFQDPNEEKTTGNELGEVSSLINNVDIKTEKSQLLISAKRFKDNFISEKIGQRGQKRLNQLLPLLIINCRKQQDPVNTFERCLELIQSIGRRTAYFELLVENPPLLKHLVSLMSQSKWLVSQLKLYPSLLDELLFPANFGKILTKEDLQDNLNQSLLRIEPENIEEQLLAIGRFKVASQFKVAAGFLNHRFHIIEVTRQLTDIAELCLQALLRLAWLEIAAKYGVPENTSLTENDFAVLGYGKLGSHELGFGSDLDLVFLYRGSPTALTNGKKEVETSQFYTRLTQRLVHYLNTRTQQGIMYEVDTRLRPSGRSGLLVSEFSAFIEYQKNDAWAWEKQALTRARVVAGDIELAKRYQDIRSNLISTDINLKKDVVTMRQKMRSNLDRTSDESWDIKQGKGGLVDIEFLVQYWVLDLANKKHELPNIYSNHFWLDWLKENQFLSENIADKFMQIYENFQMLINQKRLDMEPGLIQYSEVSESASFVHQVWISTFNAVETE